MNSTPNRNGTRPSVLRRLFIRLKESVLRCCGPHMIPKNSTAVKSMSITNSSKHLQTAFDAAAGQLKKSFIADDARRERIDAVVLCSSNRAGVRLLMACMLAKLDRPNIDPRK